MRPMSCSARQRRTHDDQPDVNANDELGENFTMNDLIPGEYILQVVGKSHRRHVTIQAGKITFVELEKTK